eukprot:6229210-Pyramimonas_sp.AAC.1
MSNAFGSTRRAALDARIQVKVAPHGWQRYRLPPMEIETTSELLRLKNRFGSVIWSPLNVQGFMGASRAP